MAPIGAPHTLVRVAKEETRKCLMQTKTTIGAIAAFAVATVVAIGAIGGHIAAEDRSAREKEVEKLGSLYLPEARTLVDEAMAQVRQERKAIYHNAELAAFCWRWRHDPDMASTLCRKGVTIKASQ